jgi:hypothetical protein
MEKLRKPVTEGEGDAGVNDADPPQDLEGSYVGAEITRPKLVFG